MSWLEVNIKYVYILGSLSRPEAHPLASQAGQ